MTSQGPFSGEVTLLGTFRDVSSSAAPMVWVAWLVAEEIAQSMQWRRSSSEEAEGHLNMEKAALDSPCSKPFPKNTSTKSNLITRVYVS
jgi:hypothetical protein